MDIGEFDVEEENRWCIRLLYKYRVITSWICQSEYT